MSFTTEGYNSLMKKLTYLFLALLIVACSSDDNDNNYTEETQVVAVDAEGSFATSYNLDDR